MLDSADADEWGNGPGLIESVRRHKLVVLLAGLVLASLAYGWSTLQPTQYAGVVNVFLGAQNDQSGDPGRYVRSQAAFITSPQVLDRAASLSGQRLTRKQMEQRVTVNPSNNADLITIQALDPTPEGAAKLADSVALAYRQQLQDDASTAAQARVAELERVERQLAADLAKTRAELAAKPDDPVLRASEQAKTAQIESVAAQKERASADAVQAAASSATQESATLPDEPAQPKPVRNAALGGLVGIAIGSAFAWWLAGRKPRATRATAAMPGRGGGGGGNGGGGEPGESDEPDAPSGPRRQLVPAQRTAPLTTALAEALDSLRERPDRVPDRDLPQEIADEFSLRFPVDTVAVLMAGDDALQLVARSGAVGAAAVGTQYDRGLLDRLARGGTRLVDVADVQAASDERLPVGTARHVVVVPLVDGTGAVGVVLAARQPNGTIAALSGDDAAAMSQAGASVAEELHVWALLQQLRNRLSPEDPDALVARMRDWPA